MGEIEARYRRLRRLAGETGGVVADRIIVLDVLHPEVPVLDLIDLPGIVAVDVPGVTPAGKVDAVERVISAQVGLVGRGLSA